MLDQQLMPPLVRAATAFPNLLFHRIRRWLLCVSLVDLTLGIEAFDMLLPTQLRECGAYVVDGEEAHCGHDGAKHNTNIHTELTCISLKLLLSCQWYLSLGAPLACIDHRTGLLAGCWRG